jgi:hypothetical protein
MTNTTSGGYNVSLVMKDRRGVVPLPPLPYAYEFVTLEHSHCINNIYVGDFAGKGYSMFELISNNDTPDMQYQCQKFMNIMIDDADKITHEHMADIFSSLG